MTMSYKGKIELVDDLHCFVCGENNPHGLNLRFHSLDGRVSARFKVEKRHQGYMDILHGGIISSILDEASVKAVAATGHTAITAEITVRFKNHLRVGQESVVEASVTKYKGKFYETTATMMCIDGRVIATGSAKLIAR